MSYLAPAELWPLLDAARAQAEPATRLICATPRLAQSWLAADAERQVQAGRKSWLPAPIVTYEHLLHSLYENLRRDPSRAVPVPLTATQEAAIWRVIVETQTSDRPLLRTEESARLAAGAWRLAHEWQIEL